MDESPSPRRASRGVPPVPQPPPDDQPRALLLSGIFQVRGSSAYTLRLAEHLPGAGIVPRVVCPDARMVDADRRQRLQIAEHPYLGVRILQRLVLQQIADASRDAPPDLIHIQSRRVLRPGVWLAQRWQRPYVLTIHDYISHRERLRLDWDWCRRVIAVSESVRRDFATKTSAPADRLVLITSGVEVEAELPATVPPPLDPERVPVVGTAGPLEAMKGLTFFLAAARRVLATGRDVEFLIAGAGPEEANLRRLARELGISQKVTFVPYMLDFKKSLAAMDVFCLPSLQQGLGTIMLEAMALGRPVIASRVGGVYGILHDQVSGLLVPPSDSGQLADRILELLCDPLRARSIGEAGRQQVLREFSLQRMVQQTADLYRAVVAEWRAAPAPPAWRSRWWSRVPAAAPPAS